MTLGNNQLRIMSQCEISRPMTHKFINHDECDKSNGMLADSLFRNLLGATSRAIASPPIT